MRKGLTLMELIVAVTLVTVIIAAIATVDIANNQLYLTTNTEMELIQEINAAVTHVHQSVRNAAVVSVDQTAKTISVTTGAITGVYRWESNQLRYYPTGLGSYQVVATGISNFAISYPTPVDNKISYFNMTLEASGQWGTETKEITVIGSMGARPFQGMTMQVI
jgi:prepilin-type N-terminal cleavage/methylation domain-containing protein